MQVVRPCPHVGEDERPKMHDGQAIRIHRALGLFRNEVIHDAQKACREEKAHRVVAVPPLNHGVLHTGIR